MLGGDLRAGWGGEIETGATEGPKWVRVGGRSEKSNDGRR